MQTATTAEDFGDLPMAILWADESNSLYESTASGREFRGEVGTYTSNNVTRVIEGTNHGTILGNEQYAQQVSNAIRDVIAVAEMGQPLSQ